MTSRRVHIVGCHRSGTTLMMELMWHCFAFSGRVPHEQSLFKPIPANETLFLSKKPPDTTRIREVFLRDADLYVIALLRDPRAVITSRHPSKPEVYFSSYRRWSRYHQAIEEMRGHPRYLVVSYEALIESPDKIQQQVAETFPFLQRTADFSSYPQGTQISPGAEESLGSVRPIDQASINRWQSHLPRIKGQLRQYPQMSAALIKHGYETDRQWEQQLEQVTPLHQTYKEIPPHFLKRWESRFRYWLKRRAYLRQRNLA